MAMRNIFASRKLADRGRGSRLTVGTLGGGNGRNMPHTIEVNYSGSTLQMTSAVNGPGRYFQRYLSRY
jgi:hypothetical protein